MTGFLVDVLSTTFVRIGQRPGDVQPSEADVKQMVEILAPKVLNLNSRDAAVNCLEEAVNAWEYGR